MKTTFLLQALQDGNEGRAFLAHEPGNMTFKFVFLDRGKHDVEETLMRMEMQGFVNYECQNGTGWLEALKAIAQAASEFDVVVIDGADFLVADNNAAWDSTRSARSRSRLPAPMPAKRFDIRFRSPAVRSGFANLLAEFKSAVTATEELLDGYAFRVAGEKLWLELAAQLLIAERDCCPFLTFQMTAEPQMRAITIRITGPDGSKES